MKERNDKQKKKKKKEKKRVLKTITNCNKI